MGWCVDRVADNSYVRSLAMQEFSLPTYVTHYHRGQPFRSLTEIEWEERLAVIARLDFPAEAMHRFHSSYYFEQRLRYEELMYNQFVAKGGCPTRRRPHYAILGESQIWEKITTHSVRIPLAGIPSVCISFTYTDSWVAYVETDANGEQLPRKPQYGMLYRKEELEQLFHEHGWPGDRWKQERDWQHDLYVEAQIWSDKPLSPYLAC